jgi:LysM repeat protein
MRRKIIFKDTETGAELVLPVTPKDYQVDHGRQVNSLTLHTVGQANLPGSGVLLDQVIECLLPARAYPFANPGSGTNPWVYLEQLGRWSDSGTVLRFIVSDTPVNGAVILGPITYREQDGTNDIYCSIPIRGYRELAAPTTQSQATGNNPRAVETRPKTQQTYTVVRGDTLSGIARRFYGDASLYGKLAAANGIKNPNLIRVGQVLTIPDAAGLPAAVTESEKPRSQKAAEQTKLTYNYNTQRVQIQLAKEIARGGW